MAVHFSGANSQRLDTISSFNPPSTGTVMFWKKSESGALRIIGTDSSWEARISGSNMLHELRQSGVPTVNNTDGVIQHWAFGYDGTNKFVYVDGVEVYRASDAHGTGGSSILSIGAAYWNTGEEYKGWLEDVRIYNRYLSDSEIKTIHATQGVDGIVDSLIHRWPLTEGAPGTIVTQARDIIGGLHANPMGGTSSNYVTGIIRTRRKLS